MPVTYPLDTPVTIGIESIEIRAINAVAISQSPFTYQQQTISHRGQRWEAMVTIPTTRREYSAPWKAMLTALKGQVGTFLLGDPAYATPQGTVSSCTLSGSVDDETATVVMTGSLLAGDYIQLGAGSSAKLHEVLVDQTGDGSLEIWPSLRNTYSGEVVTFNSPKGVFRLATNITSHTVNSTSLYGISFEAVEAIL